MLGHTNDPFLLSPLEQAGHRGYARPILCFPLNPSYSQDEVVRILQGGLSATKEQVPYLSAEVVPDDDTDAEQRGRVMLRESDDLGGELRIRTLDKTEFPFTYEEYREKNFPIHLLAQDLVCPTDAFPRAGDRAPVFIAQANFIEGGLLLNVCSYHLVADGFSISKVLQLWAQNCRRLQPSPDRSTRDTVFLSSSAFDCGPLLLGHLSDPNKCDLSQHPELVLVDDAQLERHQQQKQDARMPATRRRFLARAYYFSQDAVARLRADASVPGHSKASLEEALVALIWRCTVAAQVSTAGDEVANPDEKSFATMAVSTRSRTFPPLAPDYMGCPLVYASAATPLADIVNSSRQENAEDGVGDEKALTQLLRNLAHKIKAEMQAVTSHRVSSLINTLQSPATVPDIERLAPVSWAGLGVHSVFVSTWCKLPFYEEDWGRAFGDGSGAGTAEGDGAGEGKGYCECMRTVAEGVMNGAQMILPTIPRGERAGGVEVIMGMEAGGGMERLEADRVWMRYAVPT